MTLSIRNVNAERRARDIARRTGKSITAVIDEALAEYEIRHAVDEKAERFRRLEVLVAEIARMPLKDPRSSKEIMDDLYDEYGLPK